MGLQNPPRLVNIGVCGAYKRGKIDRADYYFKAATTTTIVMTI